MRLGLWVVGLPLAAALLVAGCTDGPDSGPSRCLQRQEGSSRDLCYFSLATEAKNATLCGSIASGEDRSLCYHTVARETRDPSPCAHISSESRQATCYYVIAGATGDPSVCDKVANATSKAICQNNARRSPSPAAPSPALGAVLPPARDLTGKWRDIPGSATWRDNVVNWACSYEGYLELSLNQREGELTGTFAFTITRVTPNTWNTNKVPCATPGTYPPSLLKGVVSTSRFQFSGSNIDFNGGFEAQTGQPGGLTSDLLQGAFQSCPDQMCSDGTRVTGSIGKFQLLRVR